MNCCRLLYGPGIGERTFDDNVNPSDYYISTTPDTVHWN